MCQQFVFAFRILARLAFAFASCLRVRPVWLPAMCYLVSRVSYPLQVRRIQNDGYNVERHSVTTKDGYVLTLHRIPQVDPELGTLLKRPVVFLLSGLYASSDVCVYQYKMPYANRYFRLWEIRNTGRTQEHGPT